MGKKELTSANDEIAKLIIRICKNPETEKSPEMVAAISELYKSIHQIY